MLELTTDRLILRDWRISEYKLAQEYASDPEVSKYMVWGPNTERETLEFVRQSVESARERPRRVYELAMIHRESGKLIGGCGLRLVGPEDRTAMIGYVLHRDFWRQGYTSEAVFRLFSYGFGELNLHRIYATCDSENIGSESVMLKCGMRKEAHFKEDMLIRGQWRDSYLYAILSWEFRKSQDSIAQSGSISS